MLAVDRFGSISVVDNVIAEARIGVKVIRDASFSEWAQHVLSRAFIYASEKAMQGGRQFTG
jgi:hypothetical protein